MSKLTTKYVKMSEAFRKIYKTKNISIVEWIFFIKYIQQNDFIKKVGHVNIQKWPLLELSKDSFEIMMESLLYSHRSDFFLKNVGRRLVTWKKNCSFTSGFYIFLWGSLGNILASQIFWSRPLSEKFLILTNQN